MNTANLPTRRAILAGAFCLVHPRISHAKGTATEIVARVGGHRGPGPIVPPVPVPQLPVLLEDGTSTDLAAMMQGKVSALQFVLTGCGSFCPILGTIFSRVQDQLGGGDEFQLVSLSLDPVGDTPRAFTAWLAKFGAGRHWRAAIPQTGPAGIIALLQAWGLATGTSSVFHTETVLLVDRTGRLVYRFADLPDPAPVAGMMRRLAAR